MKKKCNLNKFFNEFNISLKRNAYCTGSFNGFYDVKKYDIHLNQTLELFKHDMFYELPFVDKGDKSIFLRNIFTELHRKKVELKLICLSKFSYSCNSLSFYILSKINKYFKSNKMNCRRIKYMYHKQLKCIDKALIVIESTAKDYNIKLVEDKKDNLINDVVIWDGRFLEFRQVCISLIRSGKLKINSVDEKMAIEKFAKYLGIKIPKHSDSSMAHSLHSRNNDYQPKIFNDMQKGYKIFEDEMRKKKKN